MDCFQIKVVAAAGLTLTRCSKADSPYSLSRHPGRSQIWERYCQAWRDQCPVGKRPWVILLSSGPLHWLPAIPGQSVTQSAVVHGGLRGLGQYAGRLTMTSLCPLYQHMVGIGLRGPLMAVGVHWLHGPFRSLGCFTQFFRWKLMAQFVRFNYWAPSFHFQEPMKYIFCLVKAVQTEHHSPPCSERLSPYTLPRQPMATGVKRVAAVTVSLCPLPDNRLTTDSLPLYVRQRLLPLPTFGRVGPLGLALNPPVVLIIPGRIIAWWKSRSNRQTKQFH